MSIPGINQTDKAVSTEDGHVGGDPPVCTIEHRANEVSGKKGFLHRVRIAWSSLGVGIIRPRLGLRVRHGLGVYEGGRISGERD